MEDLQSGLKTLFTVLRSGSVPGMTSEELASRVSLVISQSVHSVTQSSPGAGGPEADSSCLCLTLVWKIVTAPSSHRLPQEARTIYEDVTRRLFRDADLMSELVPLLNCQDRLLSHLTAKCVSSFVTYDLCIHGDVNPVWTSTCAETFEKSSPGCMLDTCVWSLTEVIKGVLRGECAHKQGVLMKLLAGFEAALSSLYSNLLIQDQSELTPTAKHHLNISVSTFMDLLEALTAVRLRYGLCSPVQRLMFFHTSSLLHLMASRLEYFVKKRVLLLLKRVLLRRPGEDWTLGEDQSTLQEDEFLTADMLAIAEAVLQEVAAGWLRQVCVKPQPSAFGGNRETFPDGEGKDAVMLRATSLALIKSLQIKTQHAPAEGTDCAVNVRQYLLELLAFLQDHVGQFKGEPHRCSWVLLVFGEQDDDIMESAKVLNTLYLYQRSLSSSAPEACDCGCNPHCHFVLLLQSLSFDHTVLLDFLISAETCFLEYCVLYLKLLRDNWQDFSDSCHQIEGSERTFESSGRAAKLQVLLSASEASLEGPLGTSHHTQPNPSERDSTGYYPPQLVDYGSSEESEEEGGGVSALQSGRNPDRNPEEPGEDTCRRKAVDFMEKERINSTNSLADKVLLCLTELKIVITRLHHRGLFPYNPTSLIKLLMAVEAKSHS